jgi:hypothetical protein
MRRRILDQRALHRRAEDLRRLFSGEDDMNMCTCMLEDEGDQLRMDSMDARERKWAAAKLLRPVDAETAAELEDLSEEEILMVHKEYWAMLVGRLEDEPGPDRLQRLAAQYAQTKAFVRRAWGMALGPGTRGKA